MKLLPAWIAALVIFTSIFVICATGLYVFMVCPCGRPVMVEVAAPLSPPLPTPTPYHYMTADEVLASIEENLVDHDGRSNDFDAKWEAYLKTPAGKRETALWDKWKKESKGESHD